MENRNSFWIDFSFIFLAVLLIYGTFSPWLSVAALFNVTGNNSIYGIAPAILAFGYFVFGLSGILHNSVLGQYRRDFFKGVLLINIATNMVLIGLAIRYAQAVKEFNESTSNSANDLASVEDFFGKEFTDSLQDLAKSLKPQIGTGYLICLSSSMIGLIILVILWKTNFSRNKKSGERETF